MNVAGLARPDIVAMTPYSSARSEASADGILLNANESPWPLIEDPQARSDEVDSLNRYPEPQHAELRRRLADLYGLPINHVLLSRGSDDGIDLLVRVFCRAGVDTVLDTPPGFGMYRVAAQLQGAGITDVPRNAETLDLDRNGILQALQGQTPPRIVFLTSPANPTGDLVDPDFLTELLKTASGRALVVVDEAYAEFTAARSFAAMVPDYSHLVVLRTLSKAFASAGLRCGAVLAQPDVIGLLMRAIPPYPLATPVLSLALRLFDSDVRKRQRLLVRRIMRNKSALTKRLNGRPFVRRVWAGEANFILLRVDDAGALVQHCAGLGITIRGFPSAVMLDNCVRISVGSSEEMARLDAALEAFQPGNSTATAGNRNG